MIHRVTDLTVRNSYASLPASFYSRVRPQPLNAPRLLHANTELMREMGWDPSIADDPDFLAVCSGQMPLPGGDTIATVYSGHQFGVWAGQLGDGRAHLLGEVDTPLGFLELQLKGSGRTPYSRMGDGRAVLRSSVREYLASEALHGLGIPTTRALALVVSDDPVYRETVETAAIVTRVSPSFLRFGTFEHVAQAPDDLQALMNYLLEHAYPECRALSDGKPASLAGAAVCVLETVVVRTAKLMADWLCAGFCHGVMNTDNMSMLGLTLDYGPFGFMDAFQAGHICNQTDVQGRYAWNAQPSVAYWNLHRLAGTLVGLGADADALKAVLQAYEPAFLDAYRYIMAAKLGLGQWQAGDDELADTWWQLLHHHRADFTLAFRTLAEAPDQPQPFLDLFSEPESARSWLGRYGARVRRASVAPDQRIARMNAINPVYVLRNHLAQQAIDAAAQGDASVIDTLLHLLREPYTVKAGHEAWAQPPAPGQAAGPLSCSS